MLFTGNFGIGEAHGGLGEENSLLDKFKAGNF
jgi:hypothetical protein